MMIQRKPQIYKLKVQLRFSHHNHQMYDINIITLLSVAADLQRPLLVLHSHVSFMSAGEFNYNEAGVWIQTWLWLYCPTLVQLDKRQSSLRVLHCVFTLSLTLLSLSSLGADEVNKTSFRSTDTVLITPHERYFSVLVSRLWLPVVRKNRQLNSTFTDLRITQPINNLQVPQSVILSFILKVHTSKWTCVWCKDRDKHLKHIDSWIKTCAYLFVFPDRLHKPQRAAERRGRGDVTSVTQTELRYNLNQSALDFPPYFTYTATIDISL